MSTITYIRVEHGFSAPRASFYSPQGLQRSAAVLQAINGLPMPSRKGHGGTCNYCKSLLQTGFDTMDHQPGYEALKASAARCSLCYVIFFTLRQGVPSDYIIHEAKKHQVSLSELEEKETRDMIKIKALPEDTKSNDCLKRVSISWAWEPVFSWGCDILGIYRLTPEGSVHRPSPVLATSYSLGDRSETIENWMKRCLSSHACCKLDTDHRTQMPTRVLDLESDPAGSFIRLVHPHGTVGRYAALSHCWGNIRPLTTLKTSLSSHMEGIKTKALPKMFQEVCDVLRCLHIRYLWIDTLCIVQDDPQDWERESAKMCQIFRDAFICVAALAAENCSQSLHNGFRESYVDTELGYACRVGWWHSREEPLPLDARAWALQELLLARRLLLFGHKHVSWYCKEGILCEDDLFYGLQYEEHTRMRMKRKLDSLHPENSEKSYECWHDIVSEYSSRTITFDADRIPALAGITSHFQSLLDDESLVGLWRKHFAQGLVWQTEPDACRSTSLGAPSWSWLSIKGGVDYGHFWDLLDSVTSPGTYYLDPALSLCHARIAWSGTPLSSTLASTSVAVEGTLSWITPITELLEIQARRYLEITTKVQKSVGRFILDDNTETVPDDLYCAHLATIRSHIHSSNSSLSGRPFSARSLSGRPIVLLLRPATNIENTFVRIGIGSLIAGDAEQQHGRVSISEILPGAYTTQFNLA